MNITANLARQQFDEALTIATKIVFKVSDTIQRKCYEHVSITLPLTTLSDVFVGKDLLDDDNLLSVSAYVVNILRENGYTADVIDGNLTVSWSEPQEAHTYRQVKIFPATKAAENHINIDTYVENTLHAIEEAIKSVWTTKREINLTDFKDLRVYLPADDERDATAIAKERPNSVSFFYDRSDRYEDVNNPRWFKKYQPHYHWVGDNFLLTKSHVTKTIFKTLEDNGFEVIVNGPNLDWEPIQLTKQIRGKDHLYYMDVTVRW